MTIDKIVDIINSNEDLISCGYKNKDDLTRISNKLLKKIDSLFKNVSENEKKETIKGAVRKALELHENDIVFFKNGYIFVKLFDISKIRQITDADKGTVASRYNGLDEKELESFYKNFCSIKESNNFYRDVAKKFVDTYLIEKKIDNETYEKYVFQFIQSIINDKLINAFDRNDIFFKGFSGYVFRIHFQEVFSYIANFILFEIGMSNKFIIKFLSYYSLDILIIEGRKFKVPEIKAESGLKWNVVSMMSIVKVYSKAIMTIESLEIKKESLKKKVTEFYIGEVSPIEHNNKISRDIEKVNQDFLYCSSKQDAYFDTLNITKDEKQRTSIKNDIKAIKSELQDLTSKRKKLKEKMVSQSDLAKYTQIQKEIDSINRQQHKNEKILSQNEDAYLSIKNSLIKALISKKHLLKADN